MIRVGPKETRPTHDISLSDGSDIVGLIICDTNGKHRPKQIQRRPVPRTAMKTSSGNQKYSDFEPPWSPIAQDDWSGGRGMLDFDDDITRYFDNWRANTMFGNIFLGGQETYTTGYRDQDKNLPGSVRWVPMITGSMKYLAIKFAASANYSSEYIYLWVKRKGTPDDTLKVELCSDNAGDPGAVLQSQTLDTDDVTDIVSEFYRFDITTQALVSGTSYWIKVYSNATSEDDNHWLVAVNNSAGDTKQSTDNSVWSASSVDLYYRITDADSGYKTIFFLYKRLLYAIVNKEAAAPDLYYNGDRGVADSNAGDKTYLEDGSKSWTVDEWIDCVVVITGGTGSTEEKPWRLIVDNDTDSLEVDSDWVITHDTTTEYVILGSNKWTKLTNPAHGLTGDVTDVLVVNNIAYFCQGDDIAIQRMRWYQNAGAEDYDFATDGANKAVYMAIVRSTEDGMCIWKANNKDATSDISVAKEDTIPAWGVDITFAAAITFKDNYGKINSIIEYGDESKLLWIMREGSVFNITKDSADADVADEIPLREMHSAQEYTNGIASLAHNVYLYFSFLNGMERYYSSILDDVGPNRDDGIPAIRQGIIRKMAGYPGRIFVAIDADSDGISSVLGNASSASDGSGYCEVYRAPVVGQQIKGLIFQPIPGDTIDRLWISVGDDIVWIPFPSGEINPTNDSNYPYMHESTITMGYMYAGLYDIYKFYHSLKLFTENLDEDDGITVEADYQMDEDTDWTVFSDEFDTSPMHEINLKETYGENGKRLRIRLRLQTKDNTKTPIVKGTILENVSRVPVKFAYGFAYRANDKDITLVDEPDELTAEQKMSFLDKWASELTPLIMNCNYDRYDDKTVFIDPSENVPSYETEEGYIGQLTIMEI